MMAEQSDPPVAATNDAIVDRSVTPAASSQVLLQNPVLLAHVLAFLGSKYTLALGTSWKEEANDH